MSKNNEIAEIFGHISDMLNVLGENPFKVRAYRNAAENILDLGEDIEDVAERDDRHSLVVREVRLDHRSSPADRRAPLVLRDVARRVVDRLGEAEDLPPRCSGS